VLQLTLKDTGGWDGVYTLEIETFNGREWHLIKDVAGVRMGEFDDAIAAADYDLIVAFATIAIVRDGKVKKDQARRLAEELMELDTGSIEVALVAEVEPDGPPSLTPSESPTPLGVSESSESSSETSSGDLVGPLATILASTGAPR
jgi:hypothetical protein